MRKALTKFERPEDNQVHGREGGERKKVFISRGKGEQFVQAKQGKVTARMAF